uniref:Uncharacterized protein n=1 Tax=Palpitomonas bilix TaxID=652834 RepID=A0A7S3D8W3_9EUKA|mmetsp:Transcript_27180/g.70045  ORF Transcript_27180/g.70045 Transcript_27180/m.70045 type:complete len:196 (+) Transcript_27180:326-913(+)
MCNRLIKNESMVMHKKKLDETELDRLFTEFNSTSRMGCEGLRKNIAKVIASGSYRSNNDEEVIKKQREVEQELEAALTNEGEKDVTKLEVLKEWPAAFAVMRDHVPSLRSKSVRDLTEYDIAFLQRLLSALDHISNNIRRRCLTEKKRSEYWWIYVLVWSCAAAQLLFFAVFCFLSLSFFSFFQSFDIRITNMGS